MFHGLRLSPDAAKKSTFITHLGKFEWNIAPFGLALLPSYYAGNAGHIKWFRRLCKKLHG